MTNIIRGTSGNDSLTGTPGSDEILTYAGEDTVYAGDGDDYINSNETTLWMNSGRLVAYGGGGNDKINATDDGDDQLFGEDGDDTLYGRGGDDTLTGGDGADYLSGGDGDDTLDGGVGDDKLYGGEGNDTLDGGEGNDYLYDHSGNDTLYGRAGDDEIRTSGSNALVYGGSGNDLINTTATSYYSTNGTLIAYGEEGDDRIAGGSGGSNKIYGGVGDDTLWGNDGDDTLDGGEGDDTLFGSSGKDVLTGGLGADYLSGGDGDDTLTGGDGADYLSGGDGDDTLSGGLGNDSLYGEKGDDTLWAGVGNDTVSGGLGNDSLNGEEGNDTLWGNDGDDTLDGGLGADYLRGGDGDDTLDGGEGDDTLYGGAGDDKFYYTNGSDEISGGEGEDSLTLNVAISELTNFEYNGLNVSFNINEDKVVTKSIEYYYFGAQKYTFWELLIASQENSYLENYYLKTVQEKKEILERFSQDNFSPSSYIQNSLNNSISIFWPKEAVRETGSNVSGDYLFTSISDQEKIEFRKSLDYLSSYINITFTDSDTYENSDVFVEKHVMTSGGYAASPHQGNPVPLALSSTITSLASLNRVFVHELGHVLRLDHTNDFIILRDDNGNYSGWEKPENYNIPQYFDFNQFSVMTYLGGSIGFNWISDKNFSFGPLDIAYLEQYGTTGGIDTIFKLKIDEEKSDLTVSETATIIQVTPTTNPFLLTDSGGADQFTAIDIDTNTTLVFDLYRGFVGTDITTVYGKYALRSPFIEIYPSTIIESYTGHAGTDHFILGSVEVQIDASNGDDYFYVYGMASSVINGGSGDDSIYFSNAVETYTISEEGSTINVSSEGATYALSSIEKIYFDNKLFLKPISSSYRLNAVYDSRDEGSTAYFSLVASGIDAGTVVAYTISGVSASDLVSGSLSGTVTTAAAGESKLISIPIRKDNSTEGSETLTITLDDSSSATASVIINDTSKAATYSINSGADSYDEGQSALFSLVTTNLAAGSSVAYTLSGVSASDLVSNSLTGTATVSATGTTVISLPLTADALTEGAETLTITVDDSPDTTASLMINDSSKTPVVDVTLYRTTILGDKNILGPDPVLIKALTENITKTDGVISEHFFLYAGARYDYSDIDSLITVVTRNGEFTDEFAQEISDYASSLANATYSDVVQIVGSSGIDGWLIKVAGDDGNYIG